MADYSAMTEQFLALNLIFPFLGGRRNYWLNFRRHFCIRELQDIQFIFKALLSFFTNLVVYII